MTVQAEAIAASAVVKTEKLSLFTRLAYGVGDVNAAIATQVTGFFLTAFLLDVARLRPDAVAIIVLLSNLWDAVTDPIVGNLSDRTRSRWGKRRPWLLFGAVPFGLAFMSQWIVPPFNQTGLFFYYLFAAIAMKTAFTTVNIPYTALTPELTNDYDERTSLTSFRFAFSILGGMMAVILYPMIIDMFGNESTGYVIGGGVLALFIAASALTTFAFVREKPQKAEAERPAHEQFGIIKGLRIAFQNRPFVYVVGIYLLSWLTVQFVQSNLLLYVRYWVLAEDLFPALVLTLQLTAFAFLGVWARLSARMGKRGAYYLGVGLFIPVISGLFFIQPGQIIGLFVIAFFAGICVSNALLLPWSMLPDVIEYEELQTGQRRAGVYYGLFVFIQKIGLSLALAFSAFALGRAGYINPEVAGVVVEQPESVLLTMRIMVSWFPAVLLILSIPLAVAYPITREKFSEMRASLAEKATMNSMNIEN